MTRKIFFIVGFPRSGTKLLRHILNNHDQLFITQELMFLPDLIGKLPSFGDLSDIHQFRKMHQDVTDSYYFAVRRKQGMPIIEAEQWYGACKTFDAAGLLLPVIRQETKAPESDQIWLGDKSPNYTTKLELIKAAIPEARFIHIVRDVRDAALSARKIWNKNIYRFAQRWADGMAGVRRFAAAVDSQQFIELRYEDLVSQPESTLRRLTEFLAVPYDESLLQLNKPTENFGAARGQSEVLQSNTQKYRTEMTPREDKRIQSICKQSLAYYGYEVDETIRANRLSLLESSLYLIADVYNRILFDLRLGRGLGFILRSLSSRSKTRL